MNILQRITALRISSPDWEKDLVISWAARELDGYTLTRCEVGSHVQPYHLLQRGDEQIAHIYNPDTAVAWGLCTRILPPYLDDAGVALNLAVKVGEDTQSNFSIEHWAGMARWRVKFTRLESVGQYIFWDSNLGAAVIGAAARLKGVKDE